MSKYMPQMLYQDIEEKMTVLVWEDMVHEPCSDYKTAYAYIRRVRRKARKLNNNSQKFRVKEIR